MNQSMMIIVISSVLLAVLVVGATTDDRQIITDNNSSITDNSTTTDNSTSVFSNVTLADIEIAIQCAGGAALVGTPAADKYADVTKWFEDQEKRIADLEKLAKADAADDTATARSKAAALKDLSAARQRMVRYQPPLTKTFKTSDAPKMRSIENYINAGGRRLKGTAYQVEICGLGGVAMAWCGKATA